eukprot:scaffold46700_cov59-Phaeocystis_antarctica.AAC.2
MAAAARATAVVARATVAATVAAARATEVAARATAVAGWAMAERARAAMRPARRQARRRGQARHRGCGARREPRWRQRRQGGHGGGCGQRAGLASEDGRPHPLDVVARPGVGAVRDRRQESLVVRLGVRTDGRGGDGEACALREAELHRLHWRGLGPHEVVVEGEHSGAVLGAHLVVHVVLEPAHVPPLTPLALRGAHVLGGEHRVVISVREAERGGEGGRVEGGCVDEEGVRPRLEVVGEGDALVEVAAAAAVALVAKRGVGCLREHRPVGERV